MEKGEIMDYQLEELLPAAAELTEKYTSKESSSVTYETAQMLMEAVIYCIKECEKNLSSSLRSGRGLSAGAAYQIGYEKVIQKAHLAKAVYDRIAENFEDYGCSNYRDTIIRGMPEFFLHYDAKFCPQDHILTLDYPTMNRYGDQNGIDLIYSYLCDAETEQKFLECFDTGTITFLVRCVEEKYGIPYMENICSLVLLQAVGCLLSARQSKHLRITRAGAEEIRRYFEGSSPGETEDKLQQIIGYIVQKAGVADKQTYFRREGREFAVRISNAIEHDVLETLFFIS